MQSTPRFMGSGPDQFTLDNELRAERLRKLTQETQRLLRESSKLLAAHEAAARDTAQAIEQARACVAASRAVLDRPPVRRG